MIKIHKAELDMVSDKVVETKANLLQAIAKQLAPVKSGRLRESIEVYKPYIGTRIVGSKVEYAGYQEYGTRYIMPRAYFLRALMIITSMGKR